MLKFGMDCFLNTPSLQHSIKKCRDKEDQKYIIWKERHGRNPGQGLTPTGILEIRVSMDSLILVKSPLSSHFFLKILPPNAAADA